MKHITVNKEQLELLLDGVNVDIDELALYIETLVNWAYDEGYANGCGDR